MTSIQFIGKQKTTERMGTKETGKQSLCVLDDSCIMMGMAGVGASSARVNCVQKDGPPYAGFTWYLYRWTRSTIIAHAGVRAVG